MEYSLSIGFKEFNKSEEIPYQRHVDVGNGYITRKSVKFNYIDVWTKPLPIDIIIVVNNRRVPLFNYYNNWKNLEDFHRLDLTSVIDFDITENQIWLENGHNDDKEINCRIVGKISF